MKEVLINTISNGLHGKWTHIDPKKALLGLTVNNARKKPNAMSHSCWELLHHIFIWQDVILRQIKGESIDWNKIQKDDWPSDEILQKDLNFIKLKEKFISGIDDAKILLDNVDFKETISIGKEIAELSTTNLFITLLQHLSYHIGQIVAIRQCLGDWPPQYS